jgi:hypothetical protein
MWLVDGQQRTRAILDTFQQLIDFPSRPDDWSLVRKADLDELRNNGGALLGGTLDEEVEVDEDAEDESHYWFVVLPAMPIFYQGDTPYFGRHSESRNVRRGSMFRQLRLHARVRLKSEGAERRVPPLPIGMVPLATLISPIGIFVSPGDSAQAAAELQAFTAEKADLDRLDELLPWGPQFVTGHAYEVASKDQAWARPTRWSDLYVRRQETGVREMVQRLAGLFAYEWKFVFEQFRGMFDGNRFAVGWLPRSDVSAAIDAYVRINRAGIRVRAEERALALLSRARSTLLDDLADFVSKRDGGRLVEDERALLAHESHLEMGFSVWITTVTRYATLAILGDAARRWLGLSAIDKDTFGYRLDRVGVHETATGKMTWARQDYQSPADVIGECSERATSALLLVDSTLSNELYLDHRMARPSTRLPYLLIDLLYRVPATQLEQLRSDQDFRAAIARLLHWTLLVPYLDQTDFEQLTVEIHGIDDEGARKESSPLAPWNGSAADVNESLCQALQRYQAGLFKIWRRKRSNSPEQLQSLPLGVDGVGISTALTLLAIDAFATEVRNSRSLNHTAVGWLYAIERRGKAREFCWDSQVEGYRGTGGKTGAPRFPEGDNPMAAELRRWGDDNRQSLYPEKQHLVPFAIARQIVDKGGTRATSSPSNAIGNLSWLSHRQNGLSAFADRWAVLDKERDRDNLEARGILAPAEFDGRQRTVLEIYNELRDLVLLEGEAWKFKRDRAFRLFDAFCDGRARWMVEQMKRWLEEPLTSKANSWLGE